LLAQTGIRGCLLQKAKRQNDRIRWGDLWASQPQRSKYRSDINLITGRNWRTGRPSSIDHSVSYAPPVWTASGPLDTADLSLEHRRLVMGSQRSAPELKEAAVRQGRRTGLLHTRCRVTAGCLGTQPVQVGLAVLPDRSEQPSTEWLEVWSEIVRLGAEMRRVEKERGVLKMGDCLAPASPATFAPEDHKPPQHR
jgi:transposase